MGDQVDETMSILPRKLGQLGANTPTVMTRVTDAGAAHLLAWQTDQQLAALHEAGHVVIGALLKIPPKAVDIKSRRGGRAEFAVADDTQPAFRSATRIRAEIAMSLAGLITEIHLLSEGTSGSHSDLRSATDTARELVDAGLHPDGPWLSLRAFQYREERVPDDVLGAYVHLVARVVEEERERCQRLVTEHVDAIVGLASRIYEKRRLSDGELADALIAVGIEPPERPTTEL